MIGHLVRRERHRKLYAGLDAFMIEQQQRIEARLAGDEFLASYPICIRNTRATSESCLDPDYYTCEIRRH